jgi:microcystin-dependent protein
MPIDFPSSPTTNQIYNYTGGADVRFNKSYIYNSTGWEEIIIPIGAIQSFVGFSAPNGFLLCDGTAYSRATYAALFSILSISQTGNTTSGNPTITNIPSTTNMDVGMPISGTNIQSGTTISTVNSSTSITMSKNATANGTGISFVVAPYGIGDGSTTFNAPDLRGRAGIGAGTGSGLTKRILGVTGGEENVTLTLSQMPSHNHSFTDYGHSHSGNTGVESNTHYHPSYMRVTSQEAGGYGLTITGGFQNRVIVSGNSYDYPGYQPASAQHTHSFTTNSASANITINYAGSGSGHNNMQPFLPLNFIIKY